MFEVGFTEIILIFGIALLVLGPTRLPKLAADLGRWAGRARSMARQLRTQLEQETHYDPFADTRPSTPAASNTIHVPATAPAPDPATAVAPAASASAADDESRASPAQLAADTPPVAATLAGLAAGPAASADLTSAPHSSPAGTLADEPKPG
jgi:sec-independent protein translocase protein TatB